MRHVPGEDPRLCIMQESLLLPAGLCRSTQPLRMPTGLGPQANQAESTYLSLVRESQAYL